MPRRSKLAIAREATVEKIVNPKLKQVALLLPKECEVIYCGGELARDERETSISWLESELLAEITTSNPRWIRRLERKGCIPTTVNLFDNCEVRVYSVPKRYISYTQRTKPSAKKTKEAVEA